MVEKPLWSHQSEGIKRALEHSSYAFLFEPGTGKTRTTIEVLRARYTEAGVVLPTLIICPIIVVPNWRSEILEYSNIPPESITILKGHQDKRIETLQLALDRDRNRIVIMNYESLLMDRLRKMISAWSPQAMILDESHYIKSHDAARTKYALQLAPFARYRYALTGTPVLNTYMDLFTQWLFLDNGETFGKNFYGFRGRYFFDANQNKNSKRNFGIWRLRQSMEEEIKEKINKLSLSVRKEDVLDLPPLIKQKIELELPSTHAAIYRKIKRDFLATLASESVKVVTTNKLTQMLRLLQCCSGFVTGVDEDTGESKTVVFKENPKIDALKEILINTDPHKVIVWCVFKENYKVVRKLCDQMKIGYVECHGEISNDDKFKSVDDFNTNRNTRVFIGHPKSLGIGINLVAGKYAVYFSRTYSLGDDIQSEARNYRSGSEVHDKVTRYDLVYRETIEEKVEAALREKKAISESVVTNWLLEE